MAILEKAGLDAARPGVPNQSDFTHFNAQGRARMVNVGDKAPSHRTATAGARVLVNDLKAAGIGVWGLSNWESSLFHVAEEQCDILQQLDGKLVSGFVKLRKPHKEIYEAALNQFGIKADGALFIDDKAMNIVGSNAAGIRGVRFQDPVKLRELLIANGVNIPAVQ